MNLSKVLLQSLVYRWGTTTRRGCVLSHATGVLVAMLAQNIRILVTHWLCGPSFSTMNHWPWKERIRQLCYLHVFPQCWQWTLSWHSPVFKISNFSPVSRNQQFVKGQISCTLFKGKGSIWVASTGSVLFGRCQEQSLWGFILCLVTTLFSTCPAGQRTGPSSIFPLWGHPMESHTGQLQWSIDTIFLVSLSLSTLSLFLSDNFPRTQIAEV